MELLPFFRAVAFSQAHIIQCDLPSVPAPFFTFEDDALDVSPAQGDVRPPPAAAAVPSPQGRRVRPVSARQHLQRAGVQPGHPVPEGQAQGPRARQGPQREHQAGGPAPGAFDVRDGQILSTCWIPHGFPVPITVLLPDPSTEPMVKITAVHQNTWIILCFIIGADSSFNFKYFKQVI